MSTFSRKPLAIRDVLLVQQRKVNDHRGYFFETFSHKDFDQIGISSDFVQDNQSLSLCRWTVRGLHFQLPPHAQAKLVRVITGSLFDLAVDLRRGSPSFGQCCTTILTAATADQLFIPRGFAHGFCTLEPNTEVAYKVDDYYAPACEAGILWNDPDLRIDWPVEAQDAILSQRDTILSRLADFNTPFVYGTCK